MQTVSMSEGKPSNGVSVEESPAIKKLAICVPMRGKVDCIFMQSYLSLFISLLKKRGIVAQPIFSDAMPLDRARNQLAKSAILNKADYALWLDADMVISEKHFEQAWETLHSPDPEGKERFIVTGVYYEREIPYDAVIRNKNSLGLYEKIMQFPEDIPFCVDGMGFGFVLMKMRPLHDAFSATKGYPFRWTDKVSEDLYFCELMNGGSCIDIRIVDSQKNPVTYKMWCDPLIQIPHNGSYVTQWHYLHYKLDEYTDIKELSLFKKMKHEDCYQACLHGALNMCKKWQERFGENADESKLAESDVLEFYRSTDGYLYDLTWFWSHSRSVRDQIMNRWPKNASRVLDFGCGIGDWGLSYLAEHPSSHVDFFDINRANLDYLRHRVKIREAQEVIQKDHAHVFGEEFLERKEEYDLIFALDVLEHIKNPEKAAARIRSMLKRNGILIAQISPKAAFQPQHISEIDLNQHGFLQTDVYTFVRTDSDMAMNYARNVQAVKDSMTVRPMKNPESHRVD